ncbi:PREDICTED: LOW QUALITY PROTEIN: focadhesin-like [Acropora digitifera]|uniref:LOW QUALITY PROTEIN: focadhesin-like n=1 Tax=Acropora digitifera TaxID=70779 RepID=UPI00077B0E50|nr:PREDICTED: LOW QUALITY PROTEIN: focadhesin-like [Acropora digitifera]
MKNTTTNLPLTRSNTGSTLSRWRTSSVKDCYFQIIYNNRRYLTFLWPIQLLFQVGWRLYENIVKKMTPGSILNGKSVEIPELMLLWEMIEESSEAVNRLCCRCLVLLVFNGHAELGYVLSGLLNALPSARNLSGITDAVSSLMTFQVQQCAQSNTEYKCMFSLRSPPHPFITVLTNCPDYAGNLIQHVSSMLLKSCHEPKAIFQMLEPFFKFVLQDPQPTVSAHVRQELHSTLLQTASSLLMSCLGINEGINERISQRKQLAGLIVRFLLSVVPSYQIDGRRMTQTTFLVHSLANWHLEHQEHINSHCVITDFKLIVNHLLSLCWESLSHGIDMTMSLLLLQAIQKSCPQAFSQLCVLPTLSSLLLASSPFYHAHILPLCLSIMASQTPGSSPLMAVNHVFLVLPILQIIAFPRQSFSVWAPTSVDQSVECLAIQILSHLEMEIPLLMKYSSHQEQSMVCFNIFRHWFSVINPRPSQHGVDLLSLLSKLLDQNLKPGEAGNDPSVVVVSLALKALQELCSAEVVDLCTAWKVLSVKLRLDRRPAVLCNLCQLFSIVPNLVTESQDYQNFKSEVLLFLWSLTQHQESVVACAAFDALSMFQLSDFKLCQLPKEIYHPIKDKLMSSKKNIDDDNEDQKLALETSIDNSSPPGTAFVELLSRIDHRALPGFQKLLSSMVRAEASSLPRGLAHTVSRASTHDRNMQSIPAFLMSKYEKCKSPGLSQGLAAAVLFSFEPHFEEHQGKRLRRYLVNCARRYRQMLESLLHEVPVQPSEWHRTLHMPQAWSTFMNRAYLACVEGRKAELEMQHSHGHIKDPEELATRQANAWLWVRDQMTEQLKGTSRGNPSVQGNSVLALAGLAQAVALFVQQQTSSGATEQYQRNTEWLSLVADTIMVVLDGNHKPKGPTLVWCQQVSSPSSTASSLLARSCAALSLSLLVPCLVTWDSDRIQDMVELLKNRIPGQAKAGNSATLQMSCSLGLGLFLSKLYKEHFSDLCGKEGYLMMSKALDVLENAGLTMELENTEGAGLGLGIALSFLCNETIVDSRVHLTNMYDKLLRTLEKREADPDQRLQTLCFSLSCVCVNAFHAGLLSPEEASRCSSKIQGVLDKHPQACGVSLSFGLLLHGLVSCGHAGIIHLAKQQAEVWRSILENKDVPELQQLAALNGIMGLLGSEQALLIVDSPSATGLFPSNKGSIIKFLEQIVSFSDDVGLGANTAWLLGHLFSASIRSVVGKTSVPSNYGYLTEGSILRSLFEFLLQAAKTGPHLTFSRRMVPVVLESFVSDSQLTLPPVNWASVLSPLMRCTFGEETSQLCIKLALDQAKSSSNLSSFLSSLLSPVVFIGLGELCKRELLQNLSRLVYIVSPSKIRDLYEGIFSNLWRNETDGSLRRDILEAHLSVLRLKEPPPSVIGWTITALQDLYHSYSESSLDDICLLVLARCLMMIPFDQLENLVEDTKVIAAKTLVVRCMAVGTGKAPMKWLMPCIEWILGGDLSESRRDEFLCCIVGAMVDSDHTLMNDQRQHWFLELIGQFKNAVYHSSGSSIHQMLLNCLTLLSMVCAVWCTESLLQGVVSIGQSTPDHKRVHCGTLDLLPWLLPLTLPSLLKKDPWLQIRGKVLDWLLSLRDQPQVQRNSQQKMLIQDTIISLRETEPFQKTAVWTDVIAHYQSRLEEEEREEKEKC